MGDKSVDNTPPLDAETHQKKLISLAMRQAEKSLAEGTASSQIVSHFLSLATAKEKYAAEKVKQETILLQAKIENERNALAREDMIDQVIEALRSYSGV